MGLGWSKLEVNLDFLRRNKNLSLHNLEAQENLLKAGHCMWVCLKIGYIPNYSH